MAKDVKPAAKAYATGKAYVAMVKQVHAARGRPADCALIAWLDTVTDQTPAAIRTAMLARKDYPLAALFESLLDAAQRHPEGDVDGIQAEYVAAIRARPWAQTRGLIERYLRDHGAALGDETVAALAGHVEAHHPNPKAFLGQPHIRRHLPAAVDLTHMKAPHFPKLKGVAMKGERDPGSPRGKARS